MFEVLVRLANETEFWLPPAVVIFKVLVVERRPPTLLHFRLLTETGGHVALIDEVVRADLSNVQIN